VARSVARLAVCGDPWSLRARASGATTLFVCVLLAEAWDEKPSTFKLLPVAPCCVPLASADAPRPRTLAWSCAGTQIPKTKT
jgi:hypothetical protein